MIKLSWDNIPVLKSETEGGQFEAYVLNLPLILLNQRNFDYESWQSLASEIPCGVVVPTNNNNYFYVDTFYYDENAPVVSIIPSNFITYNNDSTVSPEFYDILKPFLEQDLVIKFTDRNQYIDYIKNTVLKYYNTFE